MALNVTCKALHVTFSYGDKSTERVGIGNE